MAGNRRFVARERLRAGTGHSTLAQMAEGQQPFATILGCSDSRVPPELLFDQGFGDLFVIRVAGNVVSAEVLGSIQYAGAHLRTPLFIVLGHEGCGAVGAALAAKFYGAATTRKGIRALLRSILPGLDGIDPALPSHEQLRVAVEANVRWSMHQLRETPDARRALAERARLARRGHLRAAHGPSAATGRGSGGLGDQGPRATRRTGYIPLKTRFVTLAP